MHQPVDTPLGRLIGNPGHVASLGGDAGNIDDQTVSHCGHERQSGLRAVKRPGKVCFDEGVPVGGGEPVKGSSGHVGAGGVHHSVDAALFLFDLGEDAFHFLLIAHIQGVDRGITSGIADLLRQPRQLFSTARRYDHVGAGVGQRNGCSVPHAAAGTDDKCRLPRKSRVQENSPLENVWAKSQAASGVHACGRFEPFQVSAVQRNSPPSTLNEQGTRVEMPGQGVRL